MMSRATRLIGSGAQSVRGSVRTDLSVAGLALVAAAILGNLVEEFTAFEWSLWAIQAILALSLVLIWGYGGIFSFGQAAAYGIGGYTYGFWAINVADNTSETLTALLAAVVVGAAFAGLLGYFMFYGNVTNVYIAIITLATSLVLFAFVNSTSGSEYRIGDAPFGGYNGMTRIPRLTWRLPGGTSHELTRVQFFVVCVAAGLLIAVGIPRALTTPIRAGCGGNAAQRAAYRADRLQRPSPQAGAFHHRRRYRRVRRCFVRGVGPFHQSSGLLPHPRGLGGHLGPRRQQVQRCRRLHWRSDR